MSFLLYTGQIVDALVRSNHPRGKDLERRLWELTDEAARALADHLEIKTTTGPQTIFDDNLDATFHPSFEGQPLPELLEGCDDPNQWGE